MFGLSHLFYPWGVVLQIMAIALREAAARVIGCDH
jgi:hypothetical protein